MPEKTTIKVSEERLEKALNMCGLRLVDPQQSALEEMMYGSRTNSTKGSFDSLTGKIEVKPGFENDEKIQCLIRTLESAEEIEASVEELTSPLKVEELHD